MLLNKKIPLRYLFGKVKYEILYILVIGLLTHYLKNHFRNQIPDMPISIPAFIGTAISVLLSFKLNQSYDRWWEARKVWGGIVNDSRTFVIQMQSFIQSGNETRIQTIAHRHIAWLYSLGQALRGLDPTENLSLYLTETDLDALQAHTNKPLAILQRNSLDLSGLQQEGQLPLFSLIQLNTTLVSFSNQMGMCERIKSTVFPSTYRQYLRWIIYLFTIVLLIALGKIDIIFELPLLLAISTGFFLLEKTADSLQDPFNNQPTDTAMTAIARNIEINIRQLLGESTIPKPIEATDYYLS